MKRRMIAGVAALALFAAAASPASADRGSPGSTFPEQPRNTATACAAVLAHTGTAASHNSDVAGSIVGGLINDACYGN